MYLSSRAVRTSVVAALASVTASVALTGCAGGDPSASGHSGHGGHTTDSQSADAAGTEHDGEHDGDHDGDDAGTASDGEAAEGHEGHEGHGMPAIEAPPADADWNVADATYLTMMIGHHSQALDLSELARTRAADPGVARLAEAIDAGQGREIITMASWLDEHDVPVPTVDDVEMMKEMAGTPAMDMPGMLDADRMAELAAADGPDFDRLFLEGMIEHHEGAIGMAQDQLGSGRDIRVTEMATDVIMGQQGEINRMRELLSGMATSAPTR